ncbi:MAG: YggS family pyridoxal phosphate-dependent enzyme, partial [Bacteroidaceae bacterium]|nr:YggS family pyridoxal phosphate-dependent enzyme [Bacteroidaceae bacterium]
MASIGSNIGDVLKTLPETVRLVAISKYHPESAVQEAYEAGQRVFGESHVQELQRKHDSLPKDIEWHFIGHLQTNKVRKIIGKTALIESVDTEHLLKCIDNESEKAGVVTMVLMQVHVACEETKFGFTADELYQFFREHRYEELKATHICGIMGMASNTDDEQRVRSDFEKIAEIYRTIRDDESLGLHGFD